MEIDNEEDIDSTTDEEIIPEIIPEEKAPETNEQRLARLERQTSRLRTKMGLDEIAEEEKPANNIEDLIKQNEEIKKQNAEILLAMKNKPQAGIGGGDAGSLETKDNVLTEAQIAELTDRANKAHLDPTKFIESFKTNLQKNK